jgi:ABC-2 type transport system permease protein
VTPVPLRVFARLKLQILRNTAMSSSRRAVAFVLGLMLGVIFGLIGFVTLLTSAFSSDRPSVAVLVGSAIALGWLALPVLFFGVDETLDPARFALFPVTKGRIIAGQIVAAAIGVPAAATTVALLGFVLGSIRAGAAVAVVALIGAALTALFGILGSRAVTSTFAMSLRSRKAKDLATVAIAVLAGSIGPLEAVAFSIAGPGHHDVARRLVTILGWTPVGAGFAAPHDVAAGHPLIAVAKLAILVASIALAAALWWVTLESAMIGTAAGPRRAAKPGDSRGAVNALLPAPLRVRSAGPLIGIAGREMRYWVRDPRRRAALFTMTTVLVVFPIFRTMFHTSGFSFPTWLITGPMGVLAGVLLINMFSFDGAAYGLHVLIGVRPRSEILGRALGFTLTLLPIYAVANAVLAVVADDPRRIPAGIGAMLATTGVSLGAAAALAVPAAFPMPESRNVLAMNAGTGAERGLLSLAALAIIFAISLPALVAAHYFGWQHGWAYAAGGLVWGACWFSAGVALAVRALQRRGPDRLLTQITMPA